MHFNRTIIRNGTDIRLTTILLQVISAISAQFCYVFIKGFRYYVIDHANCVDSMSTIV